MLLISVPSLPHIQGSTNHPPRGGKKRDAKGTTLIFFFKVSLSLLFQSVLSHDQNSLSLALKFAWVPRSLRKH